MNTPNKLTIARIIATPFFMAALMVVLMLPTVAFADETLQGDTNRNGTVDVYMTISEGQNGFYETYTGEALFHALLKVPYFDIALYGLEHYYYNPDCYTGTQQPGTKQSAEGIVTTMHVFIYATEKYAWSRGQISRQGKI